MKTLNALALGYAGAITAAACMLLLSIVGGFGFYMGAMQMMMGWHMFYGSSFGGVIGGMIEAAVISFIFFYLFGLIYNRFAEKGSR